MSNIRKANKLKILSLTFRHQKFVFANLFLKVVNVIIPLLELHIILFKNVFKLYIQDLNNILVDALCHIEK